MSPAPTQAPTKEDNSSRIIPGKSLVADTSTLVGDAEQEMINSSNRVGGTFAIAVLLGGITPLWLLIL